MSKLFSYLSDLSVEWISTFNRNCLSEERTKYELLFGNGQSLWQFLPDATNEGDPNTVSAGSEGERMVVRFAGGSNNVSYYNFEKATRVDRREIADKAYIVTDSIPELDWKLTDETKTILTYTTRKVTTKRNRHKNANEYGKW